MAAVQHLLYLPLMEIPDIASMSEMIFYSKASFPPNLLHLMMYLDGNKAVLKGCILFEMTNLCSGTMRCTKH